MAVPADGLELAKTVDTRTASSPACFARKSVVGACADPENNRRHPRARARARRARPQVFASIARIDDKQIDATVDKMEQEPADILLKYVYRGLEEPTDNNASLFKWQAKILDKFGIGSVVRVLTDRKTV